jgi:hypothetical protein
LSHPARESYTFPSAWRSVEHRHASPIAGCTEFLIKAIHRVTFMNHSPRLLSLVGALLAVGWVGSLPAQSRERSLPDTFAAFASRPAAILAPVRPPDIKLSDGDPVDIAPWGERASWDNGKDIGVYWEDPRDVVRVAVAFVGTPPDPATARLQWWQSQWPERRIPRDHLSGAGESGWLDIGDWYRGKWRDGDAELKVAGNIWTYTFHPVNAKEFPPLKDFSARYRTTMKVRLLFNSFAPVIQSFQVFSDSTWHNADVSIEWGGTAKKTEVWDGHLDTFNGYADHVEPLTAKVAVAADGSWKSRVKGRMAGVRAHVWFTESPNLNSFDRTVVTVRAQQDDFSFDARDVAAGARVFAPGYGVLVQRSRDPESYPEAVARWKSAPAKPLYDRVFNEAEQSYERARADMPPKQQFYIPVGCEGGRQRFGVHPDGSVYCVNDRINQPPGKDTPRIWGTEWWLRYWFGLPAGTPAKRWTEDFCLPIVHAQWEHEGVRYTETAFATRLDPGSIGWPDMHADDTTVLMVRIVAEDIGAEPANAKLTLSLETVGRPLPLITRDGLVFAKMDQREVLRYAMESDADAPLSEQSGKLQFTKRILPNGRTTVVFKIPFINLEQPDELARLQALNFDSEFARVKKFWTQRANATTQIHTPVPQLNNFYRADISHLMINCGREVGADRLMARVGGFAYGVYGNESCMMITDLDRRGLHDEAARCLETFLHYQGTTALPGDFSSQEGIFNGAGGWESGGYNQHHGWILWAMAEHYRYTGDKAWLNRNADKLVKACQWIMRERQRTKNFPPHSLRAIEYGLMPPGSLEDIGDWRSWMSNNGFSWWGLEAIARALADVGHPQAAPLIAEAKAYRADLLAAFHEAMVRSPLVGLRDGSYIPQIPSEAHRRGRTFGWITTTLEGSIYLIRTGAISPFDPMAVNIMRDYEDNLYLSEQFGYPPDNIPDHWFCRGGFSQQPNLLCSPLPYLMRDETKHFLRSYFNAFAVGYYENTQMITEHPLPTMADWRGDHYKTSDESNSTYWLRLMFVDEQDDNLYLGRALPRAWLRDGNTPSIERSETYFGTLSLRFDSHVSRGFITAILDPPNRRPPGKMLLRFHHPEGKPMTRVTIDGKPWSHFDVKREWVELPKLAGKATITAYFQD